MISPLNMLQEQQVGKPFEAWRILIVCALLNRTHGRQVRPMIERFFEICPTPHYVNAHNRPVLHDLLRPLGFINRRLHTVYAVSEWYVGTVEVNGQEWYRGMDDGKWAISVPGCGQYAVDSLNIFLYNRSEQVSSDSWLNKYLEWKREQNSS
jgi:methyl-CpG-binding domain protein 4